MGKLLHFGMNVSSEGELLNNLRRGCVLLITFIKCVEQVGSLAEHLTRCLYRSSEKRGNDILSADEETLEQLGARLRLMSDDIGDNPVTIALLPGSRARGIRNRER